MRSIIYWVWLIPIAVYVVQFATKLTKDNGYPWYYLIGGVVFKDNIGKLFLSMALPLFVALLIGYEMQEYLSFYALMSIPLVGYYFWNQHIGRDPHWIEYAVLLVGLYVFDKAQYKVDGERMAYLAASAIIIFSVCCWMFYKSRRFVLSLLAFVMMAFLLPTKIFSPFALCIKENRDSVIRSVEYGYVLE